MAAQTFAYELVDGVIVMTHGKASPTDDEWRAHMDDLGRWRSAVRGCLVYTLGGGPSAAQRRQITAVWPAGQSPPCALLTDSAIATSLGGVISFFLKNRVKMLRPGQWPEAARFLGMAESFGPRARSIVQGQASRLGLPPPP